MVQTFFLLGAIMTLRTMLAFATIFALGDFASANDVRPRNDQFYWQCQAHTTHSDWELYTGELYTIRHEAEHSALEICNYQSGHECRLHRCRRTRAALTN